MPILVKMFSITLMYYVYIFALKLLIEMLISCIFVNLNREKLSEDIIETEPISNSRIQPQIKKIQAGF